MKELNETHARINVEKRNRKKQHKTERNTCIARQDFEAKLLAVSVQQKSGAIMNFVVFVLKCKGLGGHGFLMATHLCWAEGNLSEH